MPDSTIYRDIALRTGGDIYIGVVGPVRTGKSTFIKRFMEELVLPNIASPYDRERAKDEMPQSAAGRTVMTTEPKFIPDEAVPITLSDAGKLRARMVDCVGYIVPDALGQIEDGGPRMVRTPWSEDPMPFGQAAETGTRKVITDHSTIGVVVTTDGTIGEIPRASYENAEERIVSELKKLGRPFVIVLNSADPTLPESVSLAQKLEEKYASPVALVNVLELDGEDIGGILSMVLGEFPVRQIRVDLPEWIGALDKTHPLRAELEEGVLRCASQPVRMGGIGAAFAPLSSSDRVEAVEVRSADMGTGEAVVSVRLRQGLYYQTVSGLIGREVKDEKGLLSLLSELNGIADKYARVAPALEEVERVGYGIVTPSLEQLRLEEPEIIRESGSYGVKLRAKGPSIHMIRADIETEISPIVGTEQQSEELIHFLLREFDDEPSKLWETDLFGRSLHQLVTEGIHSKLDHIPAESRTRLSETLARIVNEGSGGLICIIL